MSSVDEPTTPGAMIAAARQRRGLSLDALAERTKIPATMLSALEADEYHRLSGPLYARSFLRSCATELGLDADDVFAAYEKHGGEPSRAPGAVPPAPDPVRIRRVGLPWGRLVASGLLLVAAGFVVVRYAGRDGAEPRDAEGEREERSAVADGPRSLSRAGSAETLGAPPAGVAIGAAAGSAPAGLPQLRFSDGATWPLVARLSLSGPGTVRARRDGESGFTEVEWPGAPGAPAVPASGIVAGRAYADGAGLVVYWGAAARVSLLLAGAADASLTVNGQPWPLAPPPGGGEFVVDVQGGTGPLP
jgi:transcriptional regulator with XRE-family HTH domain